MRIKKDCLVELEYKLYDAQGELVEGGDDEGRVTYLHGHEEIQAGLEKALSGATSGVELRVELPAGEAFGDYDPEQLIVVPRSQLPPDAEIVPGDWIEVSLTEEEGGEEEEGVEMRVVELRPDAVFLDANHPLAGQAVTFELKVVSVRPATPAEIAERADESE